MTPIPIYVLAWHRPDMTERCLREIYERTRYPYEVHLWANGIQSKEEEQFYIRLSPFYDSIHLDKRNTCVWYPKGVQHMMTPADTPYYVLNDNDYYPPKLESKCWLERMVDIMEATPTLGCLAAQVPPQILQTPGTVYDQYVECKAVGNSLRLTRREAWPQAEFRQELGKFGDDSILCEMMRQRGYHTGFARAVYCLHHQPENWGYEPEQLAQDPRKAGYKPPYEYQYNYETYVPTNPDLRL